MGAEAARGPSANTCAWQETGWPPGYVPRPISTILPTPFLSFFHLMFKPSLFSSIYSPLYSPATRAACWA